MRMHPSPPTLTSRRQSGVNRTAVTASACPASVATHCPVKKSYSRMSLSNEHAAAYIPDGSTATLYSSPVLAPSGGLYARTCLPEAVDQMLSF